MDKKSTLEIEFQKELETTCAALSPQYTLHLILFFEGYKRAVLSLNACLPTLILYLLFLREPPYQFEPYHKKVRHPFDYYSFGIDFIKPLIELEHSKIFGKEHLETIATALKNKENVILLANHQTESDPQAIAVCLEKDYPEIAESMIFVAGERVVTDPLAIPFSKGCNLLCIYSKRYIDFPPEKKEEKQMHNKKTMQLMSKLLEEGSKIIYVAPSGGRDRKNKEGKIEVAPFDPEAIELFYLMAKKAKTPTHFVPFTLSTYDLLPPPETIQKELGEVRITKRTPIHLAFAPPFDMENFPGSNAPDKQQRRQARAQKIWEIVCNTHDVLVR
ncbi:MAG TPA: 1-acyl-sn-glycerol-3-phosphate acyltransferase [Chlamydiales bacterium]|nr:1-acyl-sn-glycerol-3-phosphate acyltransferase [Chlamydiales bacterium]